MIGKADKEIKKSDEKALKFKDKTDILWKKYFNLHSQALLMVNILLHTRIG